jgi:uncharacterized membrane protein YeaQ/YmgE (transglycosylase-associated protein family)
VAKLRRTAWSAVEADSLPLVLIIGILGFGILVGWLAYLIVPGTDKVSWGRTIAVGLLGSFVGGLIISLFAGDGISLRPSGLIGSLVGAILLVIGDQFILPKLRRS